MHDHSSLYGTAEPDLSKCRTSSVGAFIPGTGEEMYYCRLNNADCRYAMTFGFDYICKHQDRRFFLIPEDADPETFPVRRRANLRKAAQRRGAGSGA